MDLSERYKNLKIIGKGSYGNVYSALDNERMVKVAIKEIPKNRLKQEEIETMVTLSSFPHPNIVQLYEYFVCTIPITSILYNTELFLLCRLFQIKLIW